jgi:hypothetical protein
MKHSEMLVKVPYEVQEEARPTDTVQLRREPLVA